MKRARALLVALSIAGCAPTERVDSRTAIEPFVVAAPANAPAVLPERAGLPLRVAAGPDAWIEITPIDVRAAARSEERGAAIYRGARHEMDLAYTVGARFVEELWVLHEPAARAELRWRVTHGPRIASIAPHFGGLIARDREGVAVLHAARPFVVDAAGVRRDATLTLHGDRLELSAELAGLRAPIVIDPVWALDANMSVPRMVHTATTLPSGDVLIVGGVSNAGGTVEHSSAERYDLKTRAFVAMPSMRDARYGHSATTLASGQILVAAGSDRSTAERFDPGTATWTVTGAMRARRTYHIAARLLDGRVLVAGGSVSLRAISDAEIYDPGTDAWSAIPPLNVPRTYHRAVRLADGRVFVTGGLDATGSAVASTEIYDPATNTWSLAAPMNLARERHELALLSSGTALAFGGRLATTDTSSAELYNAATNTWSIAASMPRRSVFGGHHVLSDGTIFAILSSTGETTSNTATFDPSKATWAADATLRVRRQGAAIAALGTAVLITGGSNPTETTTATSESTLPTYALGTPCVGDGQCLSGKCVDGVCCERACGPCETCAATGTEGTCTAWPDGARPHCDVGKCRSGVCITTCTVDTDCGSLRCRDGTCVERTELGEPCTSSSDCTSNHCVDGICCNSACTGPCATCTSTSEGLSGRCIFVIGSPVHGACPAPSCQDRSIAVAAGSCEGTSECHTKAVDCAPFACHDGACRTSCEDDDGCASGSFCSGGVCVRLAPPRCDGDVAIDTRGRPLSCAPFLCSAGACTDLCPTGKCGAGMVCFSGRCARPASGVSSERSTFGCSARGPGESPWLSLLLVVGLVARKRSARRRAAATPT